jgi:hypothetical protein
MLHKTTVIAHQFTRGLCAVLVSLSLLLYVPALAFAEGDTTTCVPPKAGQPGNHTPTGSDAGMFTYNCSTLLWESAHYIYNPITKATTPKDSAPYTYNPSSGLWDTEVWDFSAAKGAYVLRTVSVSEPPVGATKIGGPAPAPIAQNPVNGSTTLPEEAQASSAAGTPSANSASSTQQNGVSGSNMVAQTLLNSTATTGNATIVRNMTGGNAVSGDATVSATIINALQSNSNMFGPSSSPVIFTTNINGDVTGDFLLDPATIQALQPAASNPNNTLVLQTVANTNQAIDTTVTIAATSGNAVVDRNTMAGNATSGDATVTANVINMLNSVVTSGQSFLGLININGNLNGDILLPEGFIDQLLASNTPTVQISTDLDLTTSNNQAIHNILNSSATSGNAEVSGNTTAGKAVSGNARNTITAFNLTGSSVIGSNSLIVFVNVQGTWYGMIINTPSGSTAGQLGGGITSTPAPISPTTAGTETEAIVTTNQRITNVINASAQSGDASITRNTTAGDAVSGNARAAINVLNIANSTLSLSNWFGLLFINVFGNWNGSFGIDTLAGGFSTHHHQPINRPIDALPNNMADSGVSENLTPFRFIAHNMASNDRMYFGGPNATGFSNQAVLGATDDNNDLTHTAILASNTTRPYTAGTLRSTPHQTKRTIANDPIMLLSFAAIGVGSALLLGERIVTLRRRL